MGCPTFVNVGGDCPGSGYLTNALPEGDGLTLVREYEDIIFIKAKDWGAFESTDHSVRYWNFSDIEQNGLQLLVDGTVQDFVAEFERESDSKPGLAPNVCCFFL